MLNARAIRYMQLQALSFAVAVQNTLGRPNSLTRHIATLVEYHATAVEVRTEAREIREHNTLK